MRNHLTKIRQKCLNQIQESVVKILAIATKIEQKRKAALAKLADERRAKKAKMDDEAQKQKSALESWITKRQFCVDKIKRFERSINNADEFEQLDIFQLDSKAEKIKGLAESFNMKCMEINCLASQPANAKEDDEIDEIVERSLVKIAAKKHQLQQEEAVKIQQNAPTAPQAADIASAAQMPETSYGNFDGSIKAWSSFEKRFIESVHNNVELTDDQRMQLLLNACSGSAKALVLEQNHDYSSAWKKLQETFGEAYANMHFCVNQILDTRNIDFASAESLRYIIKRGDKAAEIVEKVGQKDQLDAFLVVFLVSKLDQYTQRAWDRHRMGLASSWASTDGENREIHTHMPVWDELRSFLVAEVDIFRKQDARALMHGASTSTGGETPRSSFKRDRKSTNEAAPAPAPNWEGPEENRWRAPQNQRCSLCPGIHSRHACHKFREFLFDDKWDHVRQEVLCSRCTFPNHDPNPFSNKNNNLRCETCWRFAMVEDYHNSQLCPVRDHGEPFPPEQRAQNPAIRFNWN